MGEFSKISHCWAKVHSELINRETERKSKRPALTTERSLIRTEIRHFVTGVTCFFAHKSSCLFIRYTDRLATLTDRFIKYLYFQEMLGNITTQLIIICSQHQLKIICNNLIIDIFLYLSLTLSSLARWSERSRVIFASQHKLE